MKSDELRVAHGLPPSPVTQHRADLMGGSLAHTAIPKKVRQLRKFAMTLGIKRPYLLRQAELYELCKTKLRGVR